jgi:hypothetical protein
VATPIGKEAETMSTQRTFKRRVRSRMAKTGESYTSARSQLLRKAPGPDPVVPAEPGAGDEAVHSAGPAPVGEVVDPALLPTTDAAMQKATGRSYADWFRILDDWGARERTHTEIASWLSGEQGVAGWWSQSVTVGYERARGRRAIHQMSGGYSVGANRTVACSADRLLAAAIAEGQRAGWLQENPTKRRNYQGLGIRFEWADPPSRVAIFVAEKAPDKATISIQHEKLPDATAGERLKAFWRDQLNQLKSALEAAPPD